MCIRKLHLLGAVFPKWAYRFIAILIKFYWLLPLSRKKIAQLKIEDLDRHFTKEGTQLASQHTKIG